MTGPSRRWPPGRAVQAQFTRRFVAQLGMSPAQYLIQARIDRAHQLLTDSA